MIAVWPCARRNYIGQWVSLCICACVFLCVLLRSGRHPVFSFTYPANLPSGRCLTIVVDFSFSNLLAMSHLNSYTLRWTILWLCYCCCSCCCHCIRLPVVRRFHVSCFACIHPRLHISMQLSSLCAAYRTHGHTDTQGHTCTIVRASISMRHTGSSISTWTESSLALINISVQ